MPTLKELIKQIQNNPKIVKLVDPNQDYEFYKFYTVYWKETDIIKSSSICIYIDNRNTPTESAYFKDSTPEILLVQTPSPQETFISEVKTKISEVTTADTTIEKVDITNTSQDVIEATAYKYDSTSKTASKINIVFYHDKNNNLIWRKIV